MINLIRLLTIVAILSCTTVPVGDNNPRITNNFNNIAPEIEVYLSEFNELTGLKSDNLTAGFGDLRLREGAIGVCFNFGKGKKEIEIDRWFWRGSSGISKKALVFHEAVHCLCGKGHSFHGKRYKEAKEEETPDTDDPKELEKKGYFPDKCALSIMHPKIQPDFCLKAHWNEYLKEMINSCAN